MPGEFIPPHSLVASRVRWRVDDRGWVMAAGVVATLAVLALRLAFARRVEFCGGADSCFYITLARDIVTRHDFLADFVWNYQVPHVTLPSPALEYWRPGTSLLLDLAAPFGDITLRSSAAISAVFTIIAALAAADLAWTLTGDRWVTLWGYVIALCLPTFWTLALAADSAPFYGAAVAWFLALFTVRFRSRWRDLLALLCLAAAYLIRNDALLLGVPFAAVLAKRVSGQLASNTVRQELPYTIGLAGGFLLALLPAHLLTYLLTGQPANSSIGAVLFLNDLIDFSRYGDNLDFATWMGQGFRRFVLLRVSVFMQILHHLLTLFGEPATMMALIAALFGVLSNRRAAFISSLIGPLAFLVAIVLAYSIALPAIGDHAAMRSFTGLLPVLAALAAVGSAEIAATRRGFTALAAGVAAFSAIAGVDRARVQLDNGRKALAEYRTEARIIDQASRSAGPALAMVRNPAVFTTTTGIRSVSLPTNGSLAVQAAAKKFGATAIVTDQWSEAAGLADDLHAVIQHIPDSVQIVLLLPTPLDDKKLLGDRVGH
jgi:hypothetical protein